MYVVFTEIQATTTLLLQLFYGPGTLSRTTRVSQYKKGKTNLNLLEQEWQWHQLGTCKSAPHHRQPRQHPTIQFFTGCMLPNQPKARLKPKSYFQTFKNHLS